MALTYAIQRKNVVGAQKRNLVKVTVGVAGDYSTGITLDAASCGVGRIHYAKYVGSQGATTRATWEWDFTNSKLRGYKSNTAALHTEVAGADVASMELYIEVVGDQVNKG